MTKKPTMTLASVVRQAINDLGYSDFVKVRKVPKSPDFDLSIVPVENIVVDCFTIEDVKWKHVPALSSGVGGFVTRHMIDIHVGPTIYGEAHVFIESTNNVFIRSMHVNHKRLYSSILLAIDEYLLTFFAV